MIYTMQRKGSAQYYSYSSRTRSSLSHTQRPAMRFPAPSRCSYPQAPSPITMLSRFSRTYWYRIATWRNGARIKSAAILHSPCDDFFVPDRLLNVPPGAARLLVCARYSGAFRATGTSPPYMRAVMLNVCHSQTRVLVEEHVVIAVASARNALLMLVELRAFP